MRTIRAIGTKVRNSYAPRVTPATPGQLHALRVERPEKKEEQAMKPFQSKKAIWWAVAVGLIVAGIFAYAVLLPSAGEPYGTDAPDINVPSMRNAPEQSGTHKLDLEVPEEEQAKDSGE